MFRKLLAFLACSAVLDAAEFPKPFNTGTDVGKKPISANEAVKLIKLPPGFKATVFAAEPDVQNPIACAWDSRGRLWIAENYTYAEGRTNFDKTLRDRILIFEDSDNDGRFEKRTVFADNLEKLTSIELGYGGVYATAPPYLLFIADRDGDDKPDTPILTTEHTESTEKGGKEKSPAPANASVSSGRAVVKLPGTNYEILLDGFDAWSIRHNFVNGLRWGPGGWLYGRHGIQATSRVGAPGTPDAERVPMNCGIWRFHPVRRTFEVVCWGGTNPWGLDWNAEGEGFFTNTVIGHVYHLIPGAHYERMYGEDLNPNIYQLLPQSADHYHFDRSKTWTDSRTGKANDFGGGHAHCGCMIYQGDNWPAKYRGKLFTLNLHGRRMNCERLERKGSTYVAKHEPDFAQFGDPWFRGIDLTTGPDGGVYVLDWSDDGECHEEDGVHRESGRIYKITHGEVKKPVLGEKGDLAAMGNAELMALGWVGAEWEARMAARLFAERMAAKLPTEEEMGQIGEAMPKLRKKIRPREPDEDFGVVDPNGDYRARRLFHLASLASGDKPRAPLTRGDKETVRDFIVNDPLKMGSSGRLSLCRDMRGASVDEALFVMQVILSLGIDNDDQVLPLLYWSTFERLFSEKDDATVNEAAKAAYEGKIRIVLENAARRVTYDLAKRPAPLDGLLALAVKSFDETKAGCITRGISAALRGAAKAPAPANWPAFAEKAAKIPALADKVRELNVIFGDGRALEEIRTLALDGKAGLATRRQAVESLISSGDSGLRGICEKVVGNGDLAPVAIRGLATFDDPAAATLAVRNWNRVRADARPGVIGSLCSRPVFAQALLTAIRAGKISRENLTAYHARQIADLGDAAVSALLAEVWGAVRTTPDDKKRRIAALKTALTPDVLAKADITNGRGIYTQICAACHTLFDLGQTGANLGPNLTGSGRANLDYLLENIVDPSAAVPADYKLSTVTLKDGRVLSGFISTKNEQILTLRTMTENQTLPAADVTRIEGSPLSLMPDGLLDSLTPEQVRDLFGFLMRK